MADLTDVQILSIRQIIGDHEGTTADEYDLKDSQIEAVFDANNGNLINTYVDLLRHRLGMWINKTDAISETGGSTIDSQKPRHIKMLLDYWESKAGESGFTLGEGTASVALLDFGLNQDDS